MHKIYAKNKMMNNPKPVSSATIIGVAIKYIIKKYIKEKNIKGTNKEIKNLTTTKYDFVVLWHKIIVQNKTIGKPKKGIKVIKL